MIRKPLVASQQGFIDWCRVTVVIGGAGREEGPLKDGNVTVVYTSLNAHGASTAN